MVGWLVQSWGLLRALLWGKAQLHAYIISAQVDPASSSRLSLSYPTVSHSVPGAKSRTHTTHLRYAPPSCCITLQKKAKEEGEGDEEQKASEIEEKDQDEPKVKSSSKAFGPAMFGGRSLFGDDELNLAGASTFDSSLAIWYAYVCPKARAGNRHGLNTVGVSGFEFIQVPVCSLFLGNIEWLVSGRGVWSLGLVVRPRCCIQQPFFAGVW